MAGSLIKLDEVIVNTSASNITLGNTNWDNSFNAYQILITNAQVDVDNTDFRLRFLNSGTPITDSLYDVAAKRLFVGSSFDSQTNEDQTSIDLTMNIGNSSTEHFQSNIFIFCANQSQFTYCTFDNAMRSPTGDLRGKQGVGVLKQTQIINGVQLIQTVNSGVYSLYGIAKE